MVDVESENEVPQYRVGVYDLVTAVKSVEFKLYKPRPSHWSNEDTYKIVEV